MKLATFVSFLIAASVVFAAPSTVFRRDPPVGVVTTYNGIDGTVPYSFGQCIPFRIDGALINAAQVNALAKCIAYSDPHCASATLVEAVVPPGVNIPNFADFVELFSESGICYELE